MANSDRPNGLIPVGTKSGSPWNASVREYEVDSSNASAIGIGTAVIQEADGNVTPATAGTGNEILGVVVGVVPTGNVEADNFLTSANLSTTEHPGYLAASTAGRVLVAIGQDVLFVAQMDSGTAVTAVARGGRRNFNNNSVSATTGRSTAELDADGVTTTAGDQFAIIDYVHSPDNDLSVEHSKWIVSINNYQLAEASAGI